MHKTTYLLTLLTAFFFAAVAPLYAQTPGMPPFSDETGQSPSAASSSSVATNGLPPIETPKPLEAEIFPYKERPLRDPFWTVGYFPPQWGEERLPKRAVSASEWRIPTSQLEVSGVSRMGDRVMAIVNNDLKKVGDVVEIAYLGKVFQWKVSDIQADGNVRFDRHQIINESSVNRSTP